MKKYDNFYKADEGKMFVATEKLREWASYRDAKVGKPVNGEPNYASASMIEQGALIEVDDPDWVEMPGFKVELNSHIYHSREMAEIACKAHNAMPWNRERPLKVVDAIYKGRRPKPCGEYKGKTVYNPDWWLFDREVGALVDEEVVDDMINAVPPKTMWSSCMQCGEPAYTTADGRSTYATFKKIADGIYEWCGYCCARENVQNTTRAQYVVL